MLTKELLSEYIDAGAAKRKADMAILGGTLTSQSDGAASTNALGRVHDRVRRDLTISDAMQIASTLSRQLLAPLAVLNCGVSDPRLLPWFRFDTREAEDIATFAQAFPALASRSRKPKTKTIYWGLGGRDAVPPIKRKPVFGEKTGFIMRCDHALAKNCLNSSSCSGLWTT